MHTKRVALATDPLLRFNDALRRPHAWTITGIEAFWIENASGRRLIGESPDTGPAFAAVLTAIRQGSDPDDLVVVGRRPSGHRSVLGSGLDLRDVAEAAAGIPARRRVARE